MWSARFEVICDSESCISCILGRPTKLCLADWVCIFKTFSDSFCLFVDIGETVWKEHKIQQKSMLCSFERTVLLLFAVVSFAELLSSICVRIRIASLLYLCDGMNRLSAFDCLNFWLFVNRLRLIGKSLTHDFDRNMSLLFTARSSEEIVSSICIRFRVRFRAPFAGESV